VSASSGSGATSTVASSSGTGGSGAFDPAHAPSTLGAFTTQGSVGCAVPGASTGVKTVTLGVDGAMRTATVFVPASYDPEQAYPAVFVFHGDGGTGAGIRAQLDLEPDAAGKAIFAYPDGLQKTWDDKVIGTNHDMSWVMALRDSLRTKYCIDTKRTFATGMSRGGFFVNQLACRYGIAEFAAVAPHSSTIDPGDGNAYIYGPPNPQGGPFMEGNNYDFACPSDGSPPPAKAPLLPPPMLVIHGECDQEGGVEYPQGRRVAEHWGFAAQCSTTPAVAVTTSPNAACAKGSLTNDPALSVDPCYVAPGCTAGHDVTFCAIPSMDHKIWAGAHARIWAFFAAH
jgi:polyhydroxybutyrate depolymerase